MALGSMNCPFCNKRMDFNTDNPPKFCLYCGKELAANNIESQQTVPVQPQKTSQSTPPPQPAPKQSSPSGKVEMLELTPDEYKSEKQDNVFRNHKNESVLTGWLPEGYTCEGIMEPNKGDTNRPFALWAKAKSPDGKEWFCRKNKTERTDKKKEQSSFMPFDEYLDRQATEILKTNNIRLIMRVPAADDELQKVIEELRRRKESFEKLSRSGSLQVIVQGEYGAMGGKLYEADINGAKKYLYLHTYMLADEYGFQNTALHNMTNSYASMLNSMRPGLGNGMYNYAPQQEAHVDTDPSTPFGMHRSDGLSSNTLYWNIVSFGGLISDTMPQRRDICDAMRFITSLSIAPELQAAVQQFQQNMMQQNIMHQQQMANIMQQGAMQRQREMDRHNAVMSGIRADMDNIQQQMINSQNAAFDRSVRRDHEMVMGVNTYQRTDGTTFEADVRYERVFQRDNDPSLLVGSTSATVEAPPDWTELHKLK